LKVESEKMKVKEIIAYAHGFCNLSRNGLTNVGYSDKIIENLK
jgi:hypothetical protein